MNFEKYQHIARMGTPSVDGILKGEVYVFPKVDGANGSVFKKGEEIVACSRRRVLSEEENNKGFYNYVQENENIKKLLEKHPNFRMFGEWLTKRTIKGYNEDAWKKFYVFDVIDTEKGENSYLKYEEYLPILENFGILHIPLITKLENPSFEEVKELIPESDNFLLKEGEKGEGIVVKNYDFTNRYGERVWGKFVADTFDCGSKPKPKNLRNYSFEIQLADKTMDAHFVKKEFLRFKDQKGGFEKKMIGEMLEYIFDVFLKEEAYNVLIEIGEKPFQLHPFKKVVFAKIRESLPEIFEK